jgi:hypothetical protein
MLAFYMPPLRRVIGYLARLAWCWLQCQLLFHHSPNLGMADTLAKLNRL